MELEFRPLGSKSLEAFVALHARPECQGCFCMFWQFPGDNRAWQLRTADENERDKRALVLAGETHGLIALAGGEPVASVQFEPRDRLTKLTARSPYRALPPDPGVWALGCFRVLDAYRGQGVARALLRATVVHLRDACSATAVEAYPRRGEDLRPEEVWTGPESLLLAEGFVTVREHAQYPVLRRELQ